MFSHAFGQRLFSGLLLAAPLTLALFSTGCADPCKDEKKNCRDSGGSPSCASAGCFAACACSCVPDSNADAEDDLPLTETEVAAQSEDSEEPGFKRANSVGLR